MTHGVVCRPINFEMSSSTEVRGFGACELTTCFLWCAPRLLMIKAHQCARQT